MYKKLHEWKLYLNIYLYNYLFIKYLWRFKIIHDQQHLKRIKYNKFFMIHSIAKHFSYNKKLIIFFQVSIEPHQKFIPHRTVPLVTPPKEKSHNYVFQAGDSSPRKIIHIRFNIGSANPSGNGSCAGITTTTKSPKIREGIRAAHPRLLLMANNYDACRLACA